MNKATDGRPKDTPVYRISAGDEPLLFTCHFHAWKDKSPAEQQQQPAAEESITPTAIQSRPRGGSMVLAADSLKEYNRKYSYKEMTKKPPPTECIPTQLEVSSSLSLMECSNCCLAAISYRRRLQESLWNV